MELLEPSRVLLTEDTCSANKSQTTHVIDMMPHYIRAT